MEDGSREAGRRGELVWLDVREVEMREDGWVNPLKEIRLKRISPLIAISSYHFRKFGLYR